MATTNSKPSLDDNWAELRVSDDAREDPVELRRRLDLDGYLFFRRLQDPDRLRDLRREMLTVMQRGGWLVAGTDPVDGIANLEARCTEADLKYTHDYHEVYNQSPVADRACRVLDREVVYNH